MNLKSAQKSALTTHLTNKKAGGFTLIELMVVVAVMGVIASIGLVAYSNYVEASRAQAMIANFEQAVTKAKVSYIAARQLKSIGAPPTNVIPADATEWVAELNTNGSLAPGGGSAYTIGTGDVGSGAVGVQHSGSYATRDSVVTIHRPAYAGIPADSVVIAQTNY